VRRKERTTGCSTSAAVDDSWPLDLVGGEASVGRRGSETAPAPAPADWGWPLQVSAARPAGMAMAPAPSPDDGGEAPAARCDQADAGRGWRQLSPLWRISMAAKLGAAADGSSGRCRRRRVGPEEGEGAVGDLAGDSRESEREGGGVGVLPRVREDKVMVQGAGTPGGADR
jgi:hypothetical protein